MADFCLFCNKKIGLLGKLTSKTYAEGAICGSCIERLNDALYVYYQTTDGYTLDQLRIVYPHIPELLPHRAKLKEIDSKYNDFIAPVKRTLQSRESDFSMMRRENEKEIQARKLEFQKEVEKMNMEEGRDSTGKKVRYNAEEREMLREQKDYIRRGMKLEADNVDVIFAREDKTYWTYIEKRTESLGKLEKSTNLILEEAQKEIEYLKKMIRLNDGMLICERFAYVFTFVPAEKDLFGFTGKNETQSKDLVDAVKIIRATISDVLGDQAKGFNISDLSYKQLAQTQHDYAEIMGNLDVELARATGVLECQTLAIRAQEVMEDSKSESELTLELRKEYRRFKDILSKCQADYDERCNRLQKKYVSFITELQSAAQQKEKSEAEQLKRQKDIETTKNFVKSKLLEDYEMTAKDVAEIEDAICMLSAVQGLDAKSIVSHFKENNFEFENGVVEKVASYLAKSSAEKVAAWVLMQIVGVFQIEKKKEEQRRAIPPQQSIPEKIETSDSVKTTPTTGTKAVEESSSEKICPSCNKGNKSTARFCNYCGSPLLEETRFCTKDRSNTASSLRRKCPFGTRSSIVIMCTFNCIPAAPTLFLLLYHISACLRQLCQQLQNVVLIRLLKCLCQVHCVPDVRTYSNGRGRLCHARHRRPPTFAGSVHRSCSRRISSQNPSAALFLYGRFVHKFSAFHSVPQHFIAPLYPMICGLHEIF